MFRATTTRSDFPGSLGICEDQPGQSGRAARTFRYRVSGTTLTCDAAFPELDSARAPEDQLETDIRIYLAPGLSPPPEPSQWLPSKGLLGQHERAEDRADWLSCAKTSQGYRLRFHDLADFTVDAKGRDILGFPKPSTAGETLRHLLLDNVLPLALTLRGLDALHATAVLTPQGACAFIGPSGAGKSTLAAGFLYAGFPVLSDDCLVLHEEGGRFFCTPSYPGVRLWDDALAAFGVDDSRSLPVTHYASKRRPVVREGPNQFSHEVQPLRTIYVLDRKTDRGGGDSSLPLIEPLSPRAGFVELLGSTFMLDNLDRAMWLRQFHFIDHLVSIVPVKRLYVPNAFSALPSVRDAIVSDLGNRPRQP